MLKLFCAWCNKVVALEEHGDGEKIIVCPDCRLKMLNEIRTSIAGEPFKPLPRVR